MAQSFRIFVYGLTLSGESKHDVLAGAKLLGEVKTTAEYALADLRVYPALVEGGDVAVVGELYEVSPQIRFQLDVLHEESVLFVRKLITLDGGERVDSYVMPTEKAGGKRRIWNGNWKERFAVRPRGSSAEMNPFAARARSLKR